MAQSIEFQIGAIVGTVLVFGCLTLIGDDRLCAVMPAVIDVVLWLIPLLRCRQHLVSAQPWSDSSAQRNGGKPG